MKYWAIDEHWNTIETFRNMREVEEFVETGQYYWQILQQNNGGKIYVVYP